MQMADANTITAITHTQRVDAHHHVIHIVRGYESFGFIHFPNLIQSFTHFTFSPIRVVSTYEYAFCGLLFFKLFHYKAQFVINTIIFI